MSLFKINGKKFISLFLSVVMLLGVIAAMPLTASTSTEKYPYTVFGLDSVVINAPGFNLNGSGNIGSNGTIASPIQNNKIMKNLSEDMIHIGNKIENGYFLGSNVDRHNTDFSQSGLNLNINNPIQVNGDLSLNGGNIAAGSNLAIMATGNISLTCDIINANNSIIYSQQGNIDIQFPGSASLMGLIYAPHGNVTISAKGTNLNGVVIIAKNVTINSQQTANINYNDGISAFVGTESEVCSICGGGGSGHYGGIINPPTSQGTAGIRVINGNALAGTSGSDATRRVLDVDVLKLIRGTCIKANDVYGIEAITFGDKGNRQVYVDVKTSDNTWVSSPQFHGSSTVAADTIQVIMVDENGNESYPVAGVPDSGRTKINKLVYMNKYGGSPRVASNVVTLAPFVNSETPEKFDVRIRANNDGGIGHCVTSFALLDENGGVLGTSTYSTKDASGVWSAFTPDCDCCNNCGKNPCICPCNCNKNNCDICNPPCDCGIGGIILPPTSHGTVGIRVINGNALAGTSGNDASRRVLNVDVLNLINGTNIKANEIYGIETTTWGDKGNRQVYVDVKTSGNTWVSSPQFHGSSTVAADTIQAIMVDENGNETLPMSGITDSGRMPLNKIVYMNQYGGNPKVASNVVTLAPFVNSETPEKFDVRIRANNDGEIGHCVTSFSLLDENSEVLGTTVYSTHDSNGTWNEFVPNCECCKECYRASCICSSDEEEEYDFTDSDEDGLPDSYELLIGTDPNNPDTDGDGLPDGYEVASLGTDPLKTDSNDNGVDDGDEDLDGDGLSNLEEFLIETTPNNPDTDDDGLSDGDEVNVHGTAPLNPDSDDDNIWDGDELKLGLEPLNPETFGYPDAEYTVLQTITSDSEILAEINEGNEYYQLSLEIVASGWVPSNLEVCESGYSNIMENDMMLGTTLELSYPDEFTVGEVTLQFKIDDEYLDNELGLYTDDPEFQGIKRINVFKWFDELNMSLPIETKFDENNPNVLYAEVDELGSYCLVDMEKWFAFLEENAEEEVEEEFEPSPPLTVGWNGNFYIDENGVLTDYWGSGSGGHVVIPDTVTAIGDRAFYDKTNITSVVIPDGVKSIGINAFYNCYRLTYVKIGNGVKSIGINAFDNCYRLTSVTIGNSVTSIGDYAFAYTNITSITIPDSVTSIGDYAFWFCENLTSVTISNGVTSIGKSAFQRCTSLTSITIPDSVTSIGWYAFIGCTSLTTIAIPASVTSIGGNNLGNIASINVDPTNIAYSSLDGVLFNKEKKILFQYPASKNISSYSIPDGVREIENTFTDCISLTSIVIPDSVSTIGHDAFQRCPNLTSVIFKRTKPPYFYSDSTNAFRKMPNLSAIYVPKDSKELYQARPQLSGFNIVEFGPGYLCVPHGNSIPCDICDNEVVRCFLHNDPLPCPTCKGNYCVSHGNALPCSTCVSNPNSPCNNCGKVSCSCEVTRCYRHNNALPCESCVGKYCVPHGNSLPCVRCGDSYTNPCNECGKSSCICDSDSRCKTHKCEFPCPSCANICQICENEECTCFKVLVGTRWDYIRLKKQPGPGNDAHSDNDGLSDWEEILKLPGLVTVNSDGSARLPTIQQVLNYVGFLGGASVHPSMGLNRFVKESGGNFSQVVNTVRILPILSDPTMEDSDGDELDDDEEYSIGTKAINGDTDGDRLSDGFEVGLWFDPLDDNPDGDEYSDYVEYLNETNPFVYDLTLSDKGSEFLRGAWQGDFAKGDDISFLMGNILFSFVPVIADLRDYVANVGFNGDSLTGSLNWIGAILDMAPIFGMSIDAGKAVYKLGRFIAKNAGDAAKITEAVTQVSKIIPDIGKHLPASAIDDIAVSLKNTDNLTKANFDKLSKICKASGKNLDEAAKGMKFKSFRAFKSVFGEAPDGKHWHHIVEQCQGLEKYAGFDIGDINKFDNMVVVDAATHAKITGHYKTTKFPFTNGLSVREWLSGQSFEAQYEYGIKVLKDFGVV